MKKKLEYKKLSIELDYKKMTSDDKYMYTEGMISPYDDKPDLGNDIVLKGAYKRSMDQKGNERVFLYQHKMDCPVGTAVIEDSNEGLKLKEGKIVKKLYWGKESSTMIEEKIIKGLSIGYVAEKVGFEKENRLLKEIALHEVSLVTFPMNLGGKITGFKEEFSLTDELEVLLDCLGNATKADIDMMKKTIDKFSHLLITLEAKDSANSDAEKLKLEQLQKENDSKLVLDFKNYLSEKLK
jgi:HK97 family phage prohead protease